MFSKDLVHQRRKSRSKKGALSGRSRDLEQVKVLQQHSEIEFLPNDIQRWFESHSQILTEEM